MRKETRIKVKAAGIAAGIVLVIVAAICGFIALVHRYSFWVFAWMLVAVVVWYVFSAFYETTLEDLKQKDIEDRYEEE